MENRNINEMNNSSKVYALFYSFFLIPLMITIFGVLFFFLFKMLTYEKQDPYHLLNNIKSGSLTKRWQSAYELSNLFTDHSKIPVDMLFINQMITMYEKSIHDDPKVRTYLALAMGQTKNPTFGEVLIDKFEDNDLDNKIAAIKSLGEIKYKSAVPLINNIVSDEKNQRLRLAAVIALGEIKDDSSVDVLVDALEDEEPNLRWDAAISLVKLGSNKGYKVIEKLITREYYTNFPNVDELEINKTMLTVLALISQFPDKEFENELVYLSENEKNIKIKEFSMRILSEHY